MSRLGQRLRYALIVLLATTGLCVAGGYLYLQYALRDALAGGISARLGTQTQIGFAHVGLFPPGIRLSRIIIRNPAGFEDRNFLKAHDLSLDFGRYEHGAKLVHSRRMTIEGLDVWIENRRGHSNTGIIQANQKRYDRQQGLQRADKTKFIIQELRIRDINAQLRAGSSDRESEIPELVLRNVGARRGGVTLGELAGIIADAALRAAIKNELKQALDERVQEKKQELGRKLEKLFNR